MLMRQLLPEAVAAVDRACNDFFVQALTLAF
jgi:hypothetical protein